MQTEVRYYHQPKVNKPVMVCGLPGIGSVAWLAVSHLQKELKAELFAEVFSPMFSPKVWLTDEGVVKLMKGEFYFWKNKGRRTDLLLFSANEQPYSPEGQYELAEVVLDLAQKFAVQRVITMGGMATDKFTEQPKVYVGGTDVKLVKELEGYGAVKLAGGAITGTNGLIFGLAKPRKMPAICLLAETPGYLSLDANAAKAALELSSRLLKIPFDLTALDKQAKENAEAVQRARDLSRGSFAHEPKKGGELPYVS
ncbi:proteasome assembly chaperone family protein [archaeon RBG_16_50_20]|nr:MAG: proteasome assembly chaperone family protein [archaeon RBG_16_50_20]